MELTLLGTGCPSIDLNRHGPANLVDGGPGCRLLVDCGSGVTHRLLAASCPGSEIDALLLTHLHSDHIVDLFQFIISSWHQGRDRPQSIFGPPGTRQYVDGLMALWAPELEQRINYEKRPSIAALDIDVHEISDGETLDFGDMHVEVIAVNHLPVRHAFGFIFTKNAARLAISGDTAYCPALIEAAQGVDILLHEVLIHRELDVVEGKRSAETINAMKAYHTVSDQVGKVAKQCKAGKLILTHFVPPKFDEDSLLKEVRQDFDGPIIIGHDLMKFSIS
jgi:ribonuclease Z